ncbi:MAG: M61 family metallopeptidase [Planctomycetales bacterium]|nr:M61 family metallopeptidase [Planctomycetales bacterium]
MSFSLRAFDMAAPFTRRFAYLLTVLIGLLVVFEFPADANETERALNYVVDLSDAKNHYVTVTMSTPVSGERTTLMMAVWTPGSYLVREYARHLDSLVVVDENNQPLDVEKTRKNRWQVNTNGASGLRLSYRLYCNEMSVRTNWAGAEFAVLNGAPTFLTIPDRRDQPHIVELKLPRGWQRSATSLAQFEKRSQVYRAARFDELVDSPIVAGKLTVFPFDAGGVTHQLVNIGDGDYWDGTSAAVDLKRIVEAHQAFWGVTPYNRYLFLNAICETRGGLEHDFSTLIMTSRWSFRDKKKYRDWLSLASHEFFHTWNVRRLRPKALHEYDYENEVYTSSLWIAEGVTSYYQDVLLSRAGLIDQKEYLRRLSESIRSVQQNAGRMKQSLSSSSFDTWIKFYRPDENALNTRISYYRKGCVAAFLLDAKIRKLSGGHESLDDVMRRLYRDHVQAGYAPDDFRRICSEVATTNLSDWFGAVVDSTDELNYAETLALYGLEFCSETDARQPAKPNSDSTPDTSADGDNAENKTPKRWLGFDGLSPVSRVHANSPATEAGIHTDDEVLAIDGFRVTKETLEERLQQFDIGDSVQLLISRRGKIITKELKLAEQPKQDWSLRVMATPSDQQQTHLKNWLGPVAN